MADFWGWVMVIFSPSSTIEQLNAWLFLFYGLVLWCSDVGYSPVYAQFFFQDSWCSPHNVGAILTAFSGGQWYALWSDHCRWRLVYVCITAAFWGGLAGFYIDSIHPLGVIFPLIFSLGFLIPAARDLAIHLRLEGKPVHDTHRLAPH